MIDIPSPAVSIVGRHNSGKTTLIVSIIEELVARGHDVGSVKHHHLRAFDIDVPGKDSYRHRQAGASETVIAGEGQIARVRTVREDPRCKDIVSTMPGHDIVLVEGFRRGDFPALEVMRASNEADVAVAEVFAQCARQGVPLGADCTSFAHGIEAGIHAADIAQKMPSSSTVAIVTDIPAAREAAKRYGLPSFALDDVVRIADFLEEHFLRPKLTVAIQAGGESKRMKRDKALVQFAGQPLVSRAIERLSPVADEIVVTTHGTSDLEFLLREFPALNIRIAHDLHEVRGTLPGMHTALQAATNPLVAIVACDMLFASPRLIASEVRTLVESGADAVVPVNKYGYEPFHAVYRRAACLSAIDGLLKEGCMSARALFESVALREFTQAEVLAAEPLGGCFANVNTPEELHMVERLFLGE